MIMRSVQSTSMRATQHRDQAHSSPTWCDDIARIFLTASPA
jgi:hypothetical protein